MSFSDEIKLSKGACWLLVAGIIILNFIFLFVGAVWMQRDSQAELNAAKIQESRDEIKAVHDKVDDLQKMLSNQAIKDAEIKGRDFGYRMGQADKQAGH